MRASVFVLVAGPPGSGKSTLASPLASELSLPLLAKDAIDSVRPAGELWNEHHVTPSGLGRLIEVDTTDQVDVATVAGWVRSVIAEGR